MMFASENGENSVRLRQLAGCLSLVAATGCANIMGFADGRPFPEDAGKTAEASSPEGLRDHNVTNSPSEEDSGVAPVLQILPASGMFGRVITGSKSGVLVFEVFNAGLSPTKGLSATVTGSDPTMFELSDTGCVGKTLLAGAACTLGVQFAPTAAGVRSADLQVSDGSLVDAALTGEGVISGGLEASPTMGNFGDVPISGPMNHADVAFKISNGGTESSGALTTAITGSDAALFSLIADSCAGAMIPAGGDCVLTARFVPVTSGGKSATLTVKGNPGGELPISITGRGLASAAFTIAPRMSTLSQPVNVGATGTEHVRLVVANAGNIDGPANITATDVTNFAITDNCNGISLAGGGTCNIDVALEPRSSGLKSTTVTVANGVLGSNSAVVSGTGQLQRSVMVAVAGNANGTVTAPPGVSGNGISCPGDCSENYVQVTGSPVVTLTAKYDASATDVLWTAPCVGSTTSCDVTLDADKTVTVTFTKKQFVVTVTRSSEGNTGATGTVTGAGLNCPGSCTLMVNSGDSITLVASPTEGYWFNSWTGGGCVNAALTCTTQPITANIAIDAKFTKANIIFPTSATYTVDQLSPNDPVDHSDPVRGADKFCRDIASATTGLAGRTWVSLLTNDGTGALSRLSSGRGWVRTDGLPFGDQPSTFLDPGLKVFYPPSLDENGVRFPYTGNQTENVAIGTGCTKWTSKAMADTHQAGIPTTGSGGWDKADGLMPCNLGFHLYCASIDYTALVTPPVLQAGAKIAFVTASLFVPAGSTGLTAADALCQKEANMASFSGTFQALLASTNPPTTPIGRFTQSGPWVRPDGVAVGGVAMFNASTLLAPISVSSKLAYYDGSTAVWTGAANTQDPSTAAMTCTPPGGLSWSSSTDTVTKGSVGVAFYTDSRFMYDFAVYDCGSGTHLYCLQQ